MFLFHFQEHYTLSQTQSNHNLLHLHKKVVSLPAPEINVFLVFWVFLDFRKIV